MIKTIKYRYTKIVLGLVKAERLYAATIIKSWADIFFIVLILLYLMFNKTDLVATTPYWHLLVKCVLIFTSFALSIWGNYISCKNIKLKLASKMLRKNTQVKALSS